MPKIQAVLPWRFRWALGVIAGVVLVLVIGWVLFVPGADWLAHHDVGSVTGPLHESAVDNARGRLLTLGAGLAATGALVFTARNFTLSRRTFELTEQGQVTDRYTRAIEQLGSEKLDVRIGGIYALERVARDSARDSPIVMEVLAAFIREHSLEPWPTPSVQGEVVRRATRPDVQAAVFVVGRRNSALDVRGMDLKAASLPGANLIIADLGGANLAAANLSGADLTGADLSIADLTAADLTAATLTRVNLTGAILTGAELADAKLCDWTLDFPLDLMEPSPATLTFAHLDRANFSHAQLAFVDLTAATLTHATLTRATLIHATLARADLARADLTGADLTRADLRGANLGGADLTAADLTEANLEGANLNDAIWSGRTPVPSGWKLRGNSRRLEKADFGSPGAR